MSDKVHMILQGKGGIGKSYIAALLAQYLTTKNEAHLLLDIDQENTTFGSYKGLGVQALSVLGEGRGIDPKKFDGLMMAILEHDGGDVVVDTGANTFSALLAYAIENAAFELIEENGKTLVVHSVIGGGDTFIDTLHGFNDLASFVDPAGGIVVWKNAHFGALETGGVKLEDTKAFKAHAAKIRGAVVLDRRNAATFGADVNRMNSLRLTFDEVMDSDKFNVLEKNRLKIIRKSVFDQLDQLNEAGVI